MKSPLISASFFVLAVVWVAGASEEEIGKMRIKELKEFLDQREVDYAGCVEKSDLIKTAIKVKDMKPSPAKERLQGYTGEYPKKKFWEFWSEESLRVPSSSSLSEKGKKLIPDVVETCFMQHGKSVATKLKKSHEDLLKTSLKSPYYEAGVRGLNTLVQSYVSNPTLKQSQVRDLCEKFFVPWITNVGIENTNFMYNERGW
mmetsp:Transcript_28289/g.43837  ORF Transcript_28289/g.43837 Transcript_28289/m.43837 type:complete len:201 (-) Transcript_28289:56-658(-)